MNLTLILYGLATIVLLVIIMKLGEWLIDYAPPLVWAIFLPILVLTGFYILFQYITLLYLTMMV